jgi:hypothetical protein
LTTPNVSTTKIALTLCIGLVVGVVLPLALILILGVAAGILVIVAYRYFDTGIGLSPVWLSVLLVLMVIATLFFLVRFNKLLAVAALFTAVISTAYIIYVVVNLPPFGPS